MSASCDAKRRLAPMSKATFTIEEIEDAKGFLMERTGDLYPFKMDPGHLVAFLYGVEYARGRGPLRDLGGGDR